MRGGAALRVGPMREGAGVGGRRARPICGGRGCVGCAQRGGVVSMGDGAVTFKGGSISNTKGVRARLSRVYVTCCNCSCFTLHLAHDGAGHVV